MRLDGYDDLATELACYELQKANVDLLEATVELSCAVTDDQHREAFDRLQEVQQRQRRWVRELDESGALSQP